MNEEELVSRILDPWIKEIGFDAPDIDREYSFSVRVGRNEVKTGRADVVLRQHGKHLIVIEAKAPHIGLTSDTATQALSYAKLLQPRAAPVTIITNGRDSLIINTYTGEEIKGTPAKALLQYAINWEPGPEDIRLQFDALRRLIPLSESNLKAFCRSQFEWARAPFTEARPGWPVFNAELHVPRSQITDAFAKFIKSKSALFVLVGEAGMGKSSELIRLCEESLQEHFPVYIDVGRFRQVPTQALAEEFSWHFSQERTRVRLLKDLADVARDAKRMLVVFVDQVDGSSLDEVRNDLWSSIRHISDEQGTLRFVLGCRPTSWVRLAVDGNRPSPIGEGRRWHDGASAPSPDVWIRRLRGRELDTALDKVATWYELRGCLEEGIEEWCGNPLLLRLFAQAHKGQRLTSRFSASEVLTRVIAQWVPEDETSEVRGALHRLSERLVEENTDAIRESKIVNGLGEKRGVDQAIDHQLLHRDIDDYGRTWIRFAFPWFQDYCIAIYYLELDQKVRNSKALNKLREQFGDIYNNGVLRRALGWFGEAAPESARDVLFAPIVEGARRYAEAWDRMLALAPILSNGRGHATVVLVPDYSWVDPWISVRFSEKPESEKVVWASIEADIPYEYVPAHASHTNKIEELWRSWKVLDASSTDQSGPEQLALRVAKKRLEEKIKNGDFSINFNTILCQEIVWSIATTYAKELDLKMTGILTVSSIERGIAIADAAEWFMEDYCDRSMKGLYPSNRNELARRPRFEPAWVTIERDKLNEFYRKAVEAVDCGEVLSPRHRPSSIPLDTLERALSVLKSGDVEEILHPLNISSLDAKLASSSESWPELSKALEALYKTSLVVYRDLLSQALPGLMGFMRFNIQEPVQVWLDVSPYSRHAAPYFRGFKFMTVHRPKTDSYMAVDVQIFGDEYQTRVSHVKAEVYRLDTDEMNAQRVCLWPLPFDSGSFDELLVGSQAPEFPKDAKMASRRAPIRGNVLRFLKKDFREAKKFIENALERAALNESSSKQS